VPPVRGPGQVELGRVVAAEYFRANRFGGGRKSRGGPSAGERNGVRFQTRIRRWKGGAVSRSHVGGGRKEALPEEVRERALEVAERAGAARAAEVTGVNVGTIRSWLARARRKREERAVSDEGIEAIKREGARIVTEHDRALEEQGPRRLRPGEVLSGVSPEEAARYVGAVPWTAGASPVEGVEPKPKPKRKRRRRRKGAIEEAAAGKVESAGAVNAARRSLDPADDYPPVMSERPYKLTFEDGSERDVPNDGRVIGPN
jgi:hypothetical protein